MEIRPFKAFRFDPGKVGDVGSCIAPPYDVIGPEQQEQLYQKNEYNIVRIIKGKTTPSDDNSSNQYTRAADYLNKWIETGILRQDSADHIYAYVQDFRMFGSSFRRFSFIALGRLEEFGMTVRPHEQTLSGPKVDRFNLQRATGAKFGLALMLYEDEKKISERIIQTCAQQKALLDFVDEQDVRHQLFGIADKDDIGTIVKMMQNKSCIIADGHHRYETALNYYKETGKAAAAYQMLAFANTCQKGLVVLATHRLVGNLENFDFKRLLAGLEDNFQITDFKLDSLANKTEAKQKMFAQIKAENGSNRSSFGIYGGDSAFYAAVLKDERAMDSVASDMSSAWRRLDVSVLHKLVLDELLGIDEKKLAKGGYVEYVKGTDTAINDSIAEVDAGKKQAAFFMNPPKLEQLKNVTDAGEKMPQKSTYFYPKVYTGLTIYKL